MIAFNMTPCDFTEKEECMWQSIRYDLSLRQSKSVSKALLCFSILDGAELTIGQTAREPGFVRLVKALCRTGGNANGTL